ncbi:hypothetical protein C8J56DRAFT_927866 [Mycena floridula]|nr:hypothetical protein C8J56DRAFT_927866 [Mycena floridula]
MSGIRPQSGKGSLSATNLATYHHVNCDLFLHKVYHGSPEQRDNGGQQPSALKAAIYERGIRWESYLFSWLDENGLLLTIPSKPIVSSELVQNLINDERDHFFLAGLTFFPPVNELVKHFAAAGRRPVKFGIAKPDLVEITRNSDGRLEWKVIDAKSSNSVKTSHHVQIYFYTLCLKYLLPDSQFTSSGNAAIWLPPVEGFSSSIPSFNDIKTITTSLLSSSLDNFFFSQLPRIIFLDRKAVSWHYNPMCRGCPYTSECRDTAVQQGELGSMSNISIEDARSLRYLLRMSHDEDIVSSAHLSDIEDLSSLISDRGKLGRLSRKFPMTVKKVRRILSMPVREADKNISPVLNAASTKAIQVIPRRNFTCPSQEDIAVIISLLQDPSTPGMEIVSFGISVKSTTDIPLPRNIHGRGEDLIPALAALIDKILALEAPSRSTQFFVFSAGELSALQGHLINAALTSSHEDHQVRLCIGALSQGASLLQTTFQPVLLSGVLLEFLAKTQRTKFELQRCLERMGLDTEGPVPVLRQRIQSALALYQSAGHGDIARKKELGQLPRVVVVKKEIDLLLALPIPGFWDLTDCASVLLPSTHGDHCVTDEVIFGTYAEGSSITHFLEQRNETTYAVLQSMRARVKQYSQNLLVNEAKVLSASFMDICRENESLRKLFFMQQFEVLAKLTELWKARIDGCPNAPVLQYESSTQSVAGSEHSFILVSGTLDAPPGDKDRSFYDYLLVQDGDDDQIPVESLFDDLLVSSLVFPLNKYTKARWTDQHSRVQSELFIADIRDIQSDAQPARITVILRTWGGWGAKFTPGNFYRISPRLVDFNVTKVLSTLVELDFRCTDIDSSHIPFVQLIVDPSTFGRDKEIMESKAQKKRGGGIQSLFRELSNLNVESAGALVLKASQNRASQRILSNRLSVVWGPPGTGKTHTIAASLLRLMEVQHLENPDRRRVIFVTAMTHAAIDACLKKLYYLRDCYLDIEGLPTEWLSSVSFNHVLKGSEQHAPPKSPGSHLYAGTVYQVGLALSL